MKSLDRDIEEELAAKALRSEGPLLDVELELVCEEGRPCPPIRGKAMVDTGADRTAIDFTSLSPSAKSDGSYYAQGVTSEAVHLPIYALKMRFPGTDLPEVRIERAAATPHLRSQGLLALLGRDVLEQVQLTYDGPSGAFALASPEGGFTAVKSNGFATALGLSAAMAVAGLLVYKILWLMDPPKCPPCELKREGEAS